MSIVDDERAFKIYVHRVYSTMHDGQSLAEAKRRHPLPELSDDDRALIYSEAERHIREVKHYLRGEANQWFWWGAGLLALMIVIVSVTGEPEAGRNVGRMWFGFVAGIGCILFGIFRKIKPL